MEMKIYNLDLLCQQELQTGIGFIVDTPVSIAKNEPIRNPRGIYSTNFGGDISDTAEAQKRYRCDCKDIEQGKVGRYELGGVCPKCGGVVKYIDNDLEKTGWMILKDPYVVIQPRMYEFVKSVLKAKVLDDIIRFEKKLNGHGILLSREEIHAKSKNPYIGIGLPEFRNRFDEIIDALGDKKKQDVIDFLHANKDKVFTHSIPVLSLLLRPVVLIGNSTFNYDPINKTYSEMISDVYYINSNDTDEENYNNLPILYELQQKYVSLSDEIIIQKVNGKKHAIRSFILGSRINFSARHILTGNTSSVRMDAITLPYYTVTEFWKYHIMNIYKRLYNVTIQELEDRWYTLVRTQDPSIMNIINILLHKTPGGLKVYSNRNPTIAYGSITCQTLIGINEDPTDLTESLPLSILKLMNADFDGDTLNSSPMHEKRIADRFEATFSPERMLIDPSTGKFNRKIGIIKDQLVALYSFCNDDNDYEDLEKDDESFSVVTPEVIAARDAFYAQNQIVP